MKKLLLLLVALMFTLFAFASCGVLEQNGIILPGHEHNFELKDTTQPTCTSKGVYTYECVCGELTTEEFGEFAEHEYELSAIVEPTCTELGTKTYKCSCGAEKNEKYGDLSAHKYELSSTIEPTCAELGTKTYKCSCGKEKSESFGELKEHDFEFISQTDPTCTEDGSSEYKCKNCTATKTEVISATGEHSFELTNTRKPNCSRLGRYTYTCSVCNTKEYEEFGEYTDHDLAVEKKVDATCTEDGWAKYMCWNCSYKETVVLTAPGHALTDAVEMSRLRYCQNANCSYTEFPQGTGKYKDVIVYSYTDEDSARFDRIYAELEEIINAADPYDASLHGYAEGTDLHKAYIEMDNKYTELYDVLNYITSQYQIAQIEYHMDIKNEEKSAAMDAISKIRTDLVAKFYNFSEPIYNSMFREYYYYGMTEAEIKAFIFDSNAVSNAEYKALVDSNNEIELLYDAISNPASSPEVLELYGRFVENNKKIAELMGYDNYLEYAYESVYGRDYSYEDVKVIASYVKEYISPVFLDTLEKWNKISGYNPEFLNQVDVSFFEVYEANDRLNNYIDLLEFTSNPDKSYTFSDELNSLISDGNVFLGNYDGAYVTYLYGLNLPIAYFGPGYNTSFTVAHEFGHYMNEIYNSDASGQSYDLLEMHSQGNEMLYLAYLNNVLNQTARYQTETYTMVNMLNTIVIALAVDTFEQAVYTDSYDGAYSAEIMADGKITTDEYDLLFKSVIEDFGVTGSLTETYWRYVTIHAPCYYVSYSISALSVLQLYPKAREDFDAAKDSYLKLFTYTDTLEEDEYMTTEEVLQYAGLYSYTDEELYKTIYYYFRPEELVENAA